MSDQLAPPLPPFCSYPYFCRFRQCLADYYGMQRARPLLNALKYATAFPMIALSLMAPRGAPSWILASLVNAVYSSAWDLYADWEIHGGRKFYLFPLWVYPMAAMVNVALRFTWISLLFRGPLAERGSMASFAFVIQLLEISRRFLWLIFRVEAQQVQGQPLGFVFITSSEGLIPMESIKRTLSP